MFEQDLERASALYGLPLDAKQIEKFGIYYRLLIEWNAKMNLTAITEPREVSIKHIVCIFSKPLSRRWDWKA